MKLSTAEMLLYSTIRLEAVHAAGVIRGTAFFYHAELPAGPAAVLITNKHVIEDCSDLRLRCHQADESGRGPSGHSFDLNVKISSGAIALHPDPQVDVCALSIPIAEGAESQGGKVFYISLTSDLIPTEDEWNELDAYEEILMIGCPNGLYDEVNNLPILRRGITASHPAMRYNGADEFLIDAACFPGSSGSPVLLFDTFGHFDKKSGDTVLGSKRIKLLGLLFAGPVIDQTGNITLTRQVPISVSSMMYLGLVIRSSRIFELESVMQRMVEQQQQAHAELSQEPAG